MPIDRRRLLPAGAHFNPSLAWRHGRFWMIYRRVTPTSQTPLTEWPRRLALCHLGEHLQPEPGSNVDISSLIDDPPGARRWHADPRFIVRGTELWVSYHDNFNIHLVQINRINESARLRPLTVALTGMDRRERERNWGFFDDGELKAVYSIQPQVILAISDDARARPIHISDQALPWDVEALGNPHGGTSPVKLGDTWFAFFQSSTVRPSSLQRIYRVGFYGFDAAPPHRIKLMTDSAILTGDDFDPPFSWYENYSVAYPSGAVYRDGCWYVALGIHDRSLAILVVNHERLLAECRSV